MKLFGIGAVLLAVAAPAYAAPVALNCYLDTSQGRQQWSISLNEEAGTVTFSHPLATGRDTALFTPDEVIWGDGDLRINRTTLEFIRRISVGGRVYSDDRGRCEVSTQQHAF